MEKAPKKPHTYTISERASCSMSGVEKVISSSANLINLVTACGEMEINGKNLKISKFNLEDGSLAFDGEIDSVKYSVAKVPLLKRIFK
ncbi:MAG: YabP/YqfC family sporulation protein [Clostridia bacterium]|nr:YabP/YqfC family sporulation protein [Clostridia bacterium]